MEFIGKHLEIVDAKNKKLIGIKGKIINETKNMFKIKTNEKEIKLIKNNITIKINETKIKGTKIQKRPEERIKIK